MDITSYLLGKKSGGGAGTLQDKSVTITENTTTNITPDEGYDGLGEVSVTTDVTGSGAYDYFYEGAPNVAYSSVGPWYSLVKKIPGPINFTGSMTDMFMNFKGTQLPAITYSGMWASMKSFRKLFQGCENLTAIPDMSTWNTSYVTTMESMFSNCTSLTALNVSNFNTSNVENMYAMFSFIPLTEINISNFNTSKVKNIAYMFQNCTNLKTLTCNLDLTACEEVRGMFSSCTALENIGTITNIGKGFSTSQSANYNKYTFDVSSCNNLTHASLMNIINGLYDIATKGVQPQKLVLGATNIAKLSQAEQDIVTTKGWTLS